MPAEAKSAGLTHRLGVVLKTDDPEKPDWVFNVELFIPIIESLLSLIEHADTMFQFPDRREFSSIDALAGWYRSLEEIDRDPPERILLLNRPDSASCLIRVIPWVQVGGPEPYHDTYVIESFAKPSIGARLLAGLLTELSTRKIEVDQVVHGRGDPGGSPMPS